MKDKFSSNYMETLIKRFNSEDILWVEIQSFICETRKTKPWGFRIKVFCEDRAHTLNCSLIKYSNKNLQDAIAFIRSFTDKEIRLSDIAQKYL